DFALVRQRSAIGLQSAGKAKPVARDLPKCPFCVSRDSPVWISILPTCPFLGSHRHCGLFNRTRFIEFHPYCRLVHDGRGTQEHGARSAFFCKVVQVTTSRLMQRAILMTSDCQWAGIECFEHAKPPFRRLYMDYPFVQLCFIQLLGGSCREQLDRSTNT